jgi:hypothetical protein
MAEQVLSDIEILNKYGANTEWFFSNYNSLKIEYKDKYVAIDDKKVVISGTDLNKVYETIEKKKLSLLSVFVKYIPKEDIIAIL